MRRCFWVLVLCAACGKDSDPAGPEYLPLNVGREWVLRDDKGEVSIKVAARERFGGRDCFRVDWTSDGNTYQSEYWHAAGDGIYVAGRRALGKDMPMEAPYLYLKRPLKDGDRWEAVVRTLGISETLQITTGPEEEVQTGMGPIRAMRVVYRSRALEYRRWFAPGKGFVREEMYVKVGNDLRLANAKELVRASE